MTTHSVGQDKKYVCEAEEIDDRMVTRWGEPRSGCRVGEITEISNMFYILLIHNDKSGNYNQLCKPCS